MLIFSDSSIAKFHCVATFIKKVTELPFLPYEKGLVQIFSQPCILIPFAELENIQVFQQGGKFFIRTVR